MRMLRHTKPVTGLCLVSDDRLASASMDGSVLLWDLRSPGSPLHTATTPGGAGVLKIAPGPWGDILAVATEKGLHCLELFDFGAPMANIAPYPLPKPFTDIVFNTVTHDLYAGSSNGSVQVFARLA
jgi:WD40 repeat protein